MNKKETTPGFGLEKPFIGILMACTLIFSSACASLTPEVDGIYSLSPGALESDPGRTIQAQVIVDTPQVDPQLDTDRIVSKHRGVEIKYLANVRWSARAATMIQNVFWETLASSGRLPALALSGAGFNADITLALQVTEFQANFTSEEQAPLVAVAFRLSIINNKDSRFLAARTFQTNVQASGLSTYEIVRAFDQALQETSVQAGQWCLDYLAEQKISDN